LTPDKLPICVVVNDATLKVDVVTTTEFPALKCILVGDSIVGIPTPVLFVISLANLVLRLSYEYLLTRALSITTNVVNVLATDIVANVVIFGMLIVPLYILFTPLIR
jgi:hypothetical protein